MSTAFVNREQHLDELSSLMRSLSEGRGQALLVDGASGMGKTALLEEFARRADTADGTRPLVLRARCRPGFGPGMQYGAVEAVLLDLARQTAPQTLFQKVREAFRKSASTAAPEVLSAFVPGLGAALRVGTDVTKAALASGSMPFDSLLPFREGVVRQIVDELLRRARTGPPLLLVVDDVQNIDPSSLFVLDTLLHELPGEPVGVVLSYSASEAQDAHADSVDALLHGWETQGLIRRRALDGLPDYAVGELVRAQHPTAPGTLPSRLSRLTAGHPVFVQLCLDEWRPEHGEYVELPASLARVVEDRMRRLDDRDRALLATAAAQGPEFVAGTLAAVLDLPEDEVTERLRRIARSRQLIREADEAADQPDWARGDSSVCFQFQHRALWHVLYTQQTEQQRRSRHARTARALQARDASGGTFARRLEIARHLDLGGPDCLAESAAAHYTLARAAAVEGLSFTEAEQHCGKAIEAARALPADAQDRDRLLVQSIELLLSLTEVRWLGESPSAGGPRIDALAAEAEEAAVRCGDPRLIARTTLLRGKTLLATHGLVPALDKLREAVDTAAEQDDPVALFVAKVEYGRQVSKRKLADGIAQLREAEALYAAEPRLGGSGDPVLQHARNLNEMQLGVTLFDQGRLGDALDRLTRCVTRLRDETLNAELPIALNYLAQVQMGVGRYRAAEEILTEALRFEEARGGDSGWHAYNTALLAHVLAVNPRRWADALALIDAAWQETQRTWLINLVPIVRNLYAQVLLETADGSAAALERAFRLAEDSVVETRRTGMVRSEIAALSLQSRVRWAQGDLRAAEQYARDAVELLDRTGDMPALRTEEVHFHAARVLRAAGAEERAARLLERARAKVTSKAESLNGDPELRRSFLEGVALNRAALRGDLAGE